MFRFGICGFAVLALSCSSVASKDAQVPTILVLALDGIPYTTFKKLQDGGHFRNFNPVAPMVASFPSISDPNWSRIFSLEPEAGFTKSFFDPRVKTKDGFGEENGSLAAHVSREPMYEKKMDFKVSGVWEHLSMFIWTETTARYWLESLEKQFFDFRGRDAFYAIIINTDLLSHTEGEPSLFRYLAEIESRVESIQARYQHQYGRDLEVILVSDHGNIFLRPEDVPFEKGLKDAGWNLAPTINGPRDVGFYVPELLSFGAFYCQPGSVVDLARAMTKIPHVHVTMYVGPEKEIRVLGSKGESEVRYDEKADLLTYRVLKGTDPLDQMKYFKKGALKSTDYFEKSLSDKYPNAALRVWEGFNKNSITKASVLVDPDAGWVFGNKALRLITDFRGFASSHGSLQKDETLGIIVSTKRPLSAIRPQDFSKLVNIKEIGSVPDRNTTVAGDN